VTKSIIVVLQRSDVGLSGREGFVLRAKPERIDGRMLAMAGLARYERRFFSETGDGHAASCSHSSC